MQHSYVIINPHTRKKSAIVCDTIFEAQAAAGLTQGVDHGVLVHGLGYCVYEFGLFVPIEEQKYFSVGNILFAGPAVFYRYDDYGETLSLRASEFPDVRFYLGVNDIEAAIDRGEIDRPFMAVNGVELWHWPQSAPEGMRRSVD